MTPPVSLMMPNAPEFDTDTATFELAMLRVIDRESIRIVALSGALAVIEVSPVVPLLMPVPEPLCGAGDAAEISVPLPVVFAFWVVLVLPVAAAGPFADAPALLTEVPPLPVEAPELSAGAPAFPVVATAVSPPAPAATVEAAAWSAAAGAAWALPACPCAPASDIASRLDAPSNAATAKPVTPNAR